MICQGCIHFLPVGQKNPIAPVCTWKPDDMELSVLKLTLPSPALSRAMVMPTPVDVVECTQFSEAFNPLAHEQTK